MTIRWFTGADRQEMREAREFARLRAEMDLAEARRLPAADSRPVSEAQLRLMETLSLDPARRRRE